MKLVIIFLFLFPFSAFAAEPLSVVINEIAWMGTEANSADEWIELYNNTNEDIVLEDWGLYEAGGETLIEPLTGVIKGKSYYLIERTDDTTVPNIKASQTPTSWGGHGLNNNGEHLQLLDNNSNVVDEVDCKEGWFTGKGKPEYKTMERKDTLVSGNDSSNWQTSQNSGGTPKAENSLVGFQPPEEVPPEEELEPEPQEKVEEKLEPVLYPSNIFINEILPDPEGVRDAEGEYIEILNKNNVEVDLSEWQITDTAGRPTIYTFSKGIIIGPKSFWVIYRPKTKITLNNDGDNLKLVQPNGNIIDSVNYENAIKGESYNRTSSGWEWSTTLTPGETNIITQPESPGTKEPSSKLPEKEEKKSETGQEPTSVEKITLAKISRELPKPSNPLITFFIALSIAIGSGIFVLILKKRIGKED